MNLAYDPVEDDFHVRADRKPGGGPLPEKLTRRHDIVTFCQVLSHDGGAEADVTVVGVKMATQTIEEVSILVSKKWFHTDSLTTFFRLQNRAEKYPVLVTNRLNKILLSSQAQEWRRVWSPVAMSVVSRGAQPQDDDEWKLFYDGPAYIKEDEEDWPPLPPSYSTVGALLIEVDSDAADVDPPAAGQQEVWALGLIGECVTKCSQDDRLLRVFAYVIRFIDAVRAGRPRVRIPLTKDTVRPRAVLPSPLFFGRIGISRRNHHQGRPRAAFRRPHCASLIWWSEVEGQRQRQRQRQRHGR